MNKNQRLKLVRWLVFLFVVCVTVFIFFKRDQIQNLEAYGYPGIFVVSILSNATVIIPVSSVILTSAMGAILNPIYVALAAGAGAAIGELSGYLAGFSGQGVVENAAWYEKVEKWMQKYGDITVLVLAFIPNPAFDMAGISAGALRLPIARFMIMCFIGKVLKMLLFAYSGALLPVIFSPA